MVSKRVAARLLRSKYVRAKVLCWFARRGWVHARRKKNCPLRVGSEVGTWRAAWEHGSMSGPTRAQLSLSCRLDAAQSQQSAGECDCARVHEQRVTRSFLPAANSEHSTSDSISKSIISRSNTLRLIRVANKVRILATRHFPPSHTHTHTHTHRTTRRLISTRERAYPPTFFCATHPSPADDTYKAKSSTRPSCRPQS